MILPTHYWAGMQSSQVTATNGNAITWHTNYQWQGGNVITSIPI